MTDGHDEAPVTRAHELQDRVAELGETPEDALEQVAGRNDALEEKLPDGDPPHGDGLHDDRPDEERADEERADGDRADADLARGEGAPGQG
ncbi:hypothetical protein [Leifsonia shinshuensis]